MAVADDVDGEKGRSLLLVLIRGKTGLDAANANGCISLAVGFRSTCVAPFFFLATQPNPLGRPPPRFHILPPCHQGLVSLSLPTSLKHARFSLNARTLCVAVVYWRPIICTKPSAAVSADGDGRKRILHKVRCSEEKRSGQSDAVVAVGANIPQRRIAFHHLCNRIRRSSSDEADADNLVIVALSPLIRAAIDSTRLSNRRRVDCDAAKWIDVFDVDIVGVSRLRPRPSVTTMDLTLGQMSHWAWPVQYSFDTAAAGQCPSTSMGRPTNQPLRYYPFFLSSSSRFASPLLMPSQAGGRLSHRRYVADCHQ